jgi:beta-lactamase superfamily II metal-dependent hydrolase
MNKRAFLTIVMCFVVVICFSGIISSEGKIQTKAYNLKKASLEDMDSLSVEQLVIKVFPVRGHAVYLTFPDGGNMLIDTGRKNDARKLARLLKKEITADEGKFGLMGILGWKPRIDWVVLTGAGADRTGGLEKILTKFRVRKVISYANMDLKEMIKDKNLELRLRRLVDVILTLNIDHVNLAAKEEVDLEQVVSPVHLIAIDSKKNLSLRLKYADFSFVFLSDADKNTQLKIAVNNVNSIKSTVLYTGGSLTQSLKREISPKFSVSNADDITFVTDGKFLSTVPYEYLIKKK